MERKEFFAEREANYDLLRIISTIAVIILHVSAIFLNAVTDDTIFGEIYTKNIFVIVVYNTLSRFAVPCFMMISGAFLLSEKRNMDYKFFYKKALYNLGVPTIIFSVLFFVFSEVMSVRTLMGGGSFEILLQPVKDVVKGVPYYHLWYMYTLLVVYLFIPVIVRVKSDMNKKTFQRLCLISLAITTISGWTSSFELNWSVSKAICYIGYIMIGYQVRTYFIQKKNNKKAIVYLLLGIALEVLLAYIRFSCDGAKPGIDEKYAVVGNFNPLIVLSSVLIFMGVSQMELKTKKLKRIASNTFLIYLFHAGVITVLSPVIKQLDRMSFDCRIIIPVFVVIVFVVSLILANLYHYLHHCWRIKSIQ